MDIFKPDGKVIKFWLCGDSESDIKKILAKNPKVLEWWTNI